MVVIAPVINSRITGIFVIVGISEILSIMLLVRHNGSIETIC